ncbi:hypothetical protein CW702_01860 [Candidatus Bathyarchaeota archaeon]|nr:MAG: hypothetical protein CW702_01860 [Candidatus Bathyarchaeota archaeon]
MGSQKTVKIDIFRQIPSRPFNHAPTIAVLPRGDILAAWYSGSFEGARDVAILSSRLVKSEGGWSDPAILIDTPNKCDGNPVLFVDRYGDLWLFYVVMHGETWETCTLNYVKSTDDGRSWGEHGVIRKEFGWMTRNKPLILSNGDVLLPIYDEVNWRSLVLISEDDGRTWTPYGDIKTPCGVIQPTVVELEEGELLMYMRTGGEGGYIWKSISRDYGRTWSRPVKTGIKNPNSAIEMIKTYEGNLVLVFNDSSRQRTPLKVALSEDGGETWSYTKTLESGVGEFSYPSITQDFEGMIHVVYTCRIGEPYRNEGRYHAYGATIRYVSFTEEWIAGN